MRHRSKLMIITLILLFLAPIAARAALMAFEERAGSWRSADWSSTGSLPSAAAHPEARVLVMSARTGRCRSLHAVGAHARRRAGSEYIDRGKPGASDVIRPHGRGDAVAVGAAGCQVAAGGERSDLNLRAERKHAGACAAGADLGKQGFQAFHPTQVVSVRDRSSPFSGRFLPAGGFSSPKPRGRGRGRRLAGTGR